MIPSIEIVSDLGKVPYVQYGVSIAKKTVYMAAHRTNYLNEERAIVIVDREKFLDLWKATDHEGPHPFGNPESWRKDYKFHDAEDGFSHGSKNPVPLSNSMCDNYEWRHSNDMASGEWL